MLINGPKYCSGWCTLKCSQYPTNDKVTVFGLLKMLLRALIYELFLNNLSELSLKKRESNISIKGNITCNNKSEISSCIKMPQSFWYCQPIDLSGHHFFFRVLAIVKISNRNRTGVLRLHHGYNWKVWFSARFVCEQIHTRKFEWLLLIVSLENCLSQYSKADCLDKYVFSCFLLVHLLE